MLRPYNSISPRIHTSCYVDESAQIIGDVFGHDGTRMQQQVYRHRGTESVRAATHAMENLFGAS